MFCALREKSSLMLMLVPFSLRAFCKISSFSQWLYSFRMTGLGLLPLFCPSLCSLSIEVIVTPSFSLKMSLLILCAKTLCNSRITVLGRPYAIISTRDRSFIPSADQSTVKTCFRNIIFQTCGPNASRLLFSTTHCKALLDI